MNGWFVLLIALAPGIFWLWYFYKKDRIEPEPLSLLVKMFFLGVVAAVLAFLLEIPLSLLENSLPFPVSSLLFTVISVALIEESAKFFMVVQFVYKDREFDEPIDGVIYATATSLGFATLENIVYILSQSSLPMILMTGTIRAILSVPAHAVFGIFWGYALGIAKFQPERKRCALITEGLVLGIAVHSLFNLLLTESYIGFAILILLILPSIWWLAEEKIRAALLERIA